MEFVEINIIPMANQKLKKRWLLTAHLRPIHHGDGSPTRLTLLVALLVKLFEDHLDLCPSAIVNIVVNISQ